MLPVAKHGEALEVGLLPLDLLRRIGSAKAQCCVAYWNGEEGKVFLGECTGEILVQPRGERHFGWDAWFQPRGSERTFAEMTAEEKDRTSHRGDAYRKLAGHLHQEAARSSGRR